MTHEGHAPDRCAQPQQETALMICLSIVLGRFNILVLRETVDHTFRVTREGKGEVIVDLPYFSVTFTNLHRWQKCRKFART